MQYEWELGERLYKARKNAKMTQKELADAVGVSDRTIGNWELGKKRISAYNVYLLAQALHVSAGWLVAGEGEA